MIVKTCPFSIPVDDYPNGIPCIGEYCINFEWKYGTILKDGFHIPDQTKKLGACDFFDRWTGHIEENEAQ